MVEQRCPLILSPSVPILPSKCPSGLAPVSRVPPQMAPSLLCPNCDIVIPLAPSRAEYTMPELQPRLSFVPQRVRRGSKTYCFPRHTDGANVKNIEKNVFMHLNLTRKDRLSVYFDFEKARCPSLSFCTCIYSYFLSSYLDHSASSSYPTTSPILSLSW